ncbi:MAG TPA: ABC transporter permease [Zoogloea sp.]|uniref:ABC transporter permease n=2 Tax=Zoogloea sp. TaxID=49181 RepID=UPI002BB2ECC5|nr:ABC transporter permease [Zoogloea sp.]HMV16390.1 ABC transporter permease [Rhodocyclaceae bacterium]HMV61754.1 ABC transporter permease [Rhodocyclaceae bacterium]HMW51154.1 ABC transporter permease [Rhodocyclaceae bacterium]HMY48377.1 ABC transporter permease [Rhodocyclaceae bacterium]HMZ76314.1 ABC transporter permease [Rhodocyclaceae bacterium]
MSGMGQAFLEAFQLLTGFDRQVVDIVVLSLRVSGLAVLAGTLVGLPLGACLGVGRFPGRQALVIFLNACMGLPSVVVGVVVYLALSRSGPFGHLGLMYSPVAMVIAQTLLVIPLMAAIARQVVEDAWRDYAEELAAMRFRWIDSVTLLLHDCRHSLLVAVLAGLGRAMSEVGAVMIVGGNIDRSTRVMTTAIALETSKGDLPLALALGVVLLAVILLINAAAYMLRTWAFRRYA